MSIISYCERDDSDVPCTDHLPPGTTVSIKCHFGYKKPLKVKTQLVCSSSGEWSPKAFKCEPICGRVAPHSIPLQINGGLEVSFLLDCVLNIL